MGCLQWLRRTRKSIDPPEALSTAACSRSNLADKANGGFGAIPDHAPQGKASSAASPTRSGLVDKADVGLEIFPDPPQPQAKASQSLWDQAYQDLRNENVDLVQTYEKLLMSNLEIEPRPDLGDEDSSKREKQMSALVHDFLAAMNDKQWRVRLLGKSVEVRKQIDKALKYALVAKDFLSSAASIDPIHAGLPFAGLCILLCLVVNDTEQRSAAIGGLEYVAELVPRYALIERIYLQGEYSTCQVLEAKITKLYKQILKYQATAACHFSRDTVFQWARNVFGADDWGSILDDMNTREVECDRVMKIIDAEDKQVRMRLLQNKLDDQARKVDELLENQNASLGTKEERDCHKCLRTTAYEETMEKNPDRVPGTCEWFLRNSRYCKWLDDPTSELLWVTADPGCGKSVLSKYLIKDYKRWMSKGRSVCYYFFKDDSPENRSATHALCAILHQLFIQNHALLKYAMTEYNDNGNGDKLALHFELLWSILIRAAADPNIGDIVCVIDALDECAETDCAKLIEKLAELHLKVNRMAKIKFLITSRPNDSTTRPFLKHFARHNLASLKLMGENEAEMREIGAEIQLVMDAKVEEFKTRRLTDYEINDVADPKVWKKLRETENRTYLWMALIFAELEKFIDYGGGELLKAIESLPSSVDEAYERMLSKSKDPKRAKRLLHIVCAASRPLTLTEMFRALSVKKDNHGAISELPPTFGHQLRNLCGLFISVQHSKIYLIHQTAKEFLVHETLPKQADSPKSPNSTHHGYWKHSLEPTESHLVLADICIRYLLFHPSESDPLVRPDGLGPILPGSVLQDCTDEHVDEHDFLGYAAQNWTIHFRKAGTKQNTILQMAVGISSTTSAQFMRWFEIYWRVNESIYDPIAQGMTDLTVASYLGLEATVKQLLGEDGVDLNVKDETYGRTPLSWAAMKKHEEVVKLLLVQDGVCPNIKDGDDRTPLAWAEDRNMAEILLTHNGIDLNPTDDYGRTPLLAAVAQGREDVVQLLLQNNGVDLNARDQNGRTSLSWAAANDMKEVVQFLLKIDGVDPDSRDNNGRTPLSWAARSNRKDTVQLLLTQDGVDPHSEDDKGRTPLAWALFSQASEVTKELLAKGFGLDLENKDGRTPLSWAASDGEWNLEIMKEMLAKDGVNPDSKDKDGRTPLSWAAGKGSVSNVSELLARHSVNPDSKDKNGRTPLSWAAGSRHSGLQVKKLLANSDVDVDFEDNDGRTPLPWAAGCGVGISIIIQLLAKDDVDPDSKDKDGRTPLSWAAGNGSTSTVIELLARHSVDPNSIDKNGRTPLLWAAGSGYNSSIVKELLAKDGIDPDPKDKDGRTPLSWAAGNGSTSTVIELLARHSVDPNSTDKNGRTPLSWAAESGYNSSTVKKLLAKDNIDPDSKDKDGRTPLSWAAARRYYNIAHGKSQSFVIVKELLAKEGVDPNSKDKYGRTPLWYAENGGKKEMIKLLRPRTDTSLQSTSPSAEP